MRCAILENKAVGRGNRWLTLQVPGTSSLDHEPGTVVGLNLRQGSSVLRHAYTVSRCDPEARTLEFLYRVIPQGRMTPHLAALKPGADLEVLGRGGHPIAKEVDTQANALVLVSTGSGLGPLFGFSQKALSRGESRPLSLFAGFRHAEDLCLTEELRSLAAKHPNFRVFFSLSQANPDWKGLRGRVTDSMGPHLGPIARTHFHLIGNGDMVVELYEALRLVGLTEERVTSEIYFNYPEPLDRERVKTLATHFRLD
jgi:NAD(P)H-flavin reductase